MNRHRKTRTARRPSTLSRLSIEAFEVRAAAANMAFGIDDAAFSADVGNELTSAADVQLENVPSDAVRDTDSAHGVYTSDVETTGDPPVAQNGRTDASDSATPRKRFKNVDDSAALTTAGEDLTHEVFAVDTEQINPTVDLGELPSHDASASGPAGVGGQGPATGDTSDVNRRPRASQPRRDRFSADTAIPPATTNPPIDVTADATEDTGPLGDISVETGDIVVQSGDAASTCGGGIQHQSAEIDGPVHQDAADVQGVNNATPAMDTPQAPTQNRLPGDANADGHFSSDDLVETFIHGKYGTAQPATWQEGDWDEDGFFDSNDIVKAFMAGRYGMPSAISASAQETNAGFETVETSAQTGGHSVVNGQTDLNEHNNELTPQYQNPFALGDPHDLSEDETAAVVQTYIETLGLPGLNAMGTIQACQVNETIRPGFHILSSDPASLLASPVSQSAAWQQLPSLPQSTQMSYVSTGLHGVTSVVSAGTMADVVRFEDDQLYDKAIILADTVVFDDAVLTLDSSVRHLIIVARNIQSYGSPKIQWELSGTHAPDLPEMNAAADGTSNNPSTIATGNKHGGDGVDGQAGDTGNRGYQFADDVGLHGAPDVSLYVESFQVESTGGLPSTMGVVLPQIDVSGQHGGQGQTGQDGGDGGDGGKGTQGIQRYGWFAPIGCKVPAGTGGNGGDGGNGGRGGRGGDGGAGGDVNLYYVTNPQEATIDESQLSTDGGDGGDGGFVGNAGRGGDGGEGGDGSWPFCADRTDHEDFVGNDGEAGTSLGAGSSGAKGADGSLTIGQISMDEWEDAFTSPYLVATDDFVTVGESVVLETVNLSGDAYLNLRDYDGELFSSEPLTELGNDEYRWDVPLTMTAGEFELSIVRDSDHETSPYQLAIEVQPLVTGIAFEDEFEALPGGTAFVTGHGLRDDGAVIYDGHRIETSEDDYCNADDNGSSACLTATVADGQDWIRFTIPNLPSAPSASELFQHDDGLTDHVVRVEQVAPLEDSDELTVRLKRHDGLVFRPSVNGFTFSNADMTATARADLAIGLNTPIGDLTNSYEAFMSGYGEAEINALGGLTNPTVWLNFGLWYAWWANPASATCTGMSVPVMRDFFNGVSDQLNTTMDEAVDDVVEHTTHVLSPEFLNAMTFDTVADAAPFMSTTDNSIDTVVDFMANGLDTDGDEAPILVMVPDASVYLDAITAPLEFVAEQLLGLAVGLVTSNADEALADVPRGFTEMVTSFTDVINAIGSSHSLSPYLVVFDDPADEDPSRIYVYDSNAPAMVQPEDVDRAFMEIEREDGQLEFDYDALDPGDGSYIYGNDNDWILSAQSVDFLTGTSNASVLFSPDAWSLFW